MTVRNTRAAYGSLAKFFHWAVALAVLTMLILGVIIALADSTVMPKGQIVTFHKSLGLSLLIFMIIRLVWQLANPTPQMPSVIPLWQQRLIKVIYSLLYVAILATIFVGWLMSSLGGHPTRLWGLVNVTLPFASNHPLKELAQSVHECLGWAIALLIFLHVAMFMWHHLVKGNKLLKRMLPR